MAAPLFHRRLSSSLRASAAPWLAVAALLAAPRSAIAAAEEADVGRSARSIYSDFMSPYCPGMLLADCRSPAAAELRAEVRRELEAGVSEDEVRSRVEARFGEKILGAPHARGFGLLAWATPFLALAVAIAAVVAWMRSHRAAGAAPAAPEPRDPAMLARLERERRRLLGLADVAR